MHHLTRKRAIGAGAALVVAIAVAAVWIANRDRSYHRAFDAHVADPAYRGDSPVLLFDEGHLNTHTTTTGYKPFADLLRSDEYTVRVSRQPLTAPALQEASVLVLSLARGANEANVDAAYSE